MKTLLQERVALQDALTLGRRTSNLGREFPLRDEDRPALEYRAAQLDDFMELGARLDDDSPCEAAPWGSIWTTNEGIQLRLELVSDTHLANIRRSVADRLQKAQDLAKNTAARRIWGQTDLTRRAARTRDVLTCILHEASRRTFGGTEP